MPQPEHDSHPVCLITGGSSGIGLASARKFFDAGYRVVICGRSVDRLHVASQHVTGQDQLQSDRWFALPGDLGADGQTHLAEQLVEQTLAHFGQLDVLVNNAALAPLGPFDEVSVETLDSTLRLNLRAGFLLSQVAWRSMNSGGTIVNVSSMAAVDPFPGFALYGASKAWLELLTKALATEGEPRGIRVCAVRPGAVETPLLRGLFPDFPADQCVSPEDVAEVIWGCVHQPAAYASGGAFEVVRSEAS